MQLPVWWGSKKTITTCCVLLVSMLTSPSVVWSAVWIPFKCCVLCFPLVLCAACQHANQPIHSLVSCVQTEGSASWAHQSMPKSWKEKSETKVWLLTPVDYSVHNYLPFELSVDTIWQILFTEKASRREHQQSTGVNSQTFIVFSWQTPQSTESTQLTKLWMGWLTCWQVTHSTSFRRT